VCIIRAFYTSIWGHTAYYGIGDSKFRKILEMTFPTPPRHHRLPMDQGFAAQPCGLAEQQGIAYAKTGGEAMNLKLDADNPADREKLRRAVLDLVAGRKSDPNGIRTRVTAVKGRCPGPLDDRVKKPGNIGIAIVRRKVNW
jgi:hypothetical protein